MSEVNEKHVLWDEKIDKFLRKQLSAEEEEAFMDEMASDAEFKSYATMSALLIYGIRQKGKQKDDEFLNALGQMSKSDLYRAIGKKMPVTKRAVFWIPSVAAIAAVFTGFVIFNKTQINSDIQDYGISQGLSENIMRGAANEDLTAEIKRLNNNVKKQQYLASTIVRLEEMYQTATDKVTDDEDDYAYNIGWDLATAYIENGQKDDAKRILTEMKTTYPKDEKIQTLLDKLNKTFFWE